MVWDNYFITIPSLFTGSLEVSYLITDGEVTASATLSIAVLEGTTLPDEEEIAVSMIITRNGDDFNGHLKIENIAAYPNNRVLIFNRWGNKVWETIGYENTTSGRRFEGVGNTSSSGELPDGTYFYVINKGDGSTPVKGFVTLKSHAEI